jgi:ABC-2 type transport system permease protein
MLRLAVRDAWIIAVKDATEMWRDGRLRWTTGLTLVVLATSIAGGWHYAAGVARQHADAQRIERELWLDKGDMNPHAAAHYGSFVFKPVEPLSALDPGLDPYVGVSVFLEAHQQQLSRHRPIEDATPTRRLGTLSAAMSLQVLVPLLIVVLTFASIAGEREEGTLRHLLSLGVPRTTLLVGKTLGAMLPLAAVLVPAAIVGAAGMLVVQEAVDGDAIVRAGLLAAAYLVYFAIWIGLGLAVSAKARTQAGALVVLLALWFTWSFVAPPVAAAVARTLDPAPTTIEFMTGIDAERQRRPSWNERVEEVTDRFLFGGDAAFGWAANPEVTALIETEAEDTELFERHFADLFDAYTRQAATYERVGVAAPLLAMQTISMALAGTDYAHHRRFLEATGAYRAEFVHALNAELAADGRWDTFTFAGDRDLWARIPEFAFEPPGARWALGTHAWSVVILGMWLAAVAVGLAWAIRTAPVD